jgi:hypothetical protein
MIYAYSKSSNAQKIGKGKVYAATAEAVSSARDFSAFSGKNANPAAGQIDSIQGN